MPCETAEIAEQIGAFWATSKRSRVRCSDFQILAVYIQVHVGVKLFHEIKYYNQKLCFLDSNPVLPRWPTMGGSPRDESYDN